MHTKLYTTDLFCAIVMRIVPSYNAFLAIWFKTSVSKSR